MVKQAMKGVKGDKVKAVLVTSATNFSFAVGSPQDP